MPFEIIRTPTGNTAQPGPSHSLDRVIRLPGNLVLRYDSSKVDLIDTGNWLLFWYGEHNAQPAAKWVVGLLDSGFFDELWGLRGILIAVNHQKGAVHVINDSYGTFPIYFKDEQVAGSPIASSRISSMSKAGLEFDHVSVFQFISFAYVVGGYSLWKGISQLQANSMLTLAATGPVTAPSVRPLQNFWFEDPSRARSAVDDIVAILREEAAGHVAPQIMFSAGWDSRTIAAALVHRSPTAYTHGDIRSRETAIARDIANKFHLKLTEQSINEMGLNANSLKSSLERSDSAMFPHWSFGGRHAKKEGRILTAGTFGEVLGGHYGAINAAKGTSKYGALVQGLFNFPRAKVLRGRQALLATYELLRIQQQPRSWIFSEELNRLLASRDVVAESNSRLLSVLDQYLQQGTDSAQGLFERFYTEHRGARYINLQVTNACGSGGYRNIFTNRDLVAAASQIPFGYRTHNKLNKACIKALAPGLLDFPMAATLVNARRSMLIQELSRGIRKASEKSELLRAILLRSARYRQDTAGWNNFESIRSPGFLAGVSGLLQQDFWSRESIQSRPLSDTNLSMYAYLDMLCKAATIDWHLTDQAV